MKKYTTILFDLDNTLLDFTKSEAVAIRKVLKSHGLPADDNAVKTYSEINKSFWERFERGEIPKSDIFAGRFVKLLEVFEKEDNAEAMSKEYCIRLSEGHETIEGAEEILKYLKQNSYKIYATTNGLSTTQYKRIDESGLQKYFDNIFVSEDAEHQKPEKEYFDYVIEHIDEKDKSKMLVIGDSQSSDILGGINSGIDTCWFNNGNYTAKYKSDYEIKLLCELRNIL